MLKTPPLPYSNSAPEPTTSSTTNTTINSSSSSSYHLHNNNDINTLHSVDITSPFIIPGHFPSSLNLLDPTSLSIPAPILTFGLFNPSSIEHLRSSLFLMALCLCIWLVSVLGFGILGVVLVWLLFSRYFNMSHSKLLRKLRLEADYFATFRRAQLTAENADWFNLILAKFWLAYEPTLSLSIKSSLEPRLDWVCPAFIDSLKFDHFSLGTFPPQLRSIISARNTTDDIIDLQFDISLGSFGPSNGNTIPSPQNEDQSAAASTTSKLGSPTGSNNSPTKKGRIVHSINTTNTTLGDEESVLLPPHDSAQASDSSLPATQQSTEYVPIPVQSLTSSRVDLVVRIKGIALTVRAENVTIEGQMRVRMKLISAFPHVQVMELWFLEAPKIGFELRPLGGMDLTAVKSIRRWLDETIAGAVSAYLVYPNPLVLPFDDWFNHPSMDTDASIGVLVVHVKNAVGLRNAELIGKSDPYLAILINKFQVTKTQVIPNNLNPFWDEVKYVIVKKLVDSQMGLAVYDHDKTGRNKQLGAAQVDLSKFDAVNGSTHPVSEFELFDNERRSSGKLRTTISFHPVAPVSLGTTSTLASPIGSPDSDATQQVPPPATAGPALQPEIFSGILKVTCHAARGIEPGSKLRSPFVSIAYNGEIVFTTRTKKHSNTPQFEESFEIFVVDNRTAQLHFVVKDDAFNALGKPDPVLGQLTVSVLQILKTKKSKDDWYALVDGNRDARLRITMKWLPVPLKRESARNVAGVLRVRIGRCCDLKSSLGSSKINPYVRLLSSDKIKARSKRLTDTANPEFNDSLFVLVRDLSESISLQVWDYSRALKDTLIGSTIIEVGKYVKEIEEEDGTCGFEAVGSAFETADLMHSGHIKPRGKVMAEVSFHPKRPDMPFMPEQHHVSGIMKLTVHVIKDLPRKLNSYFEIYSDDPELCLYKSPIKKKTTNPIFEQAVEIFIRQVYYSPIQIILREEGGGGAAGMPGDVAAAAAKTITAGFGVTNPNNAPIQGKTAPVLGTFESYAYTEVCGGLNAERWYDLNQTNGAKIKLSFDFVPLDLAIIDPSESLSNMGMLELEVVSARDLPKADHIGLCDGFCIVLLDDQRWLKTAVQKKTLSPVWKEMVKIPVLNRFRSTLKFQVWDWDKIGANEYLAGAELNLAEIETNNQTRIDIPLLDSTGILTISYRFQPRRMEKIPSRYMTMTRATLDRLDPRKKRRNSSHYSLASMRQSMDTSYVVTSGTDQSIVDDPPLIMDSMDGLPRSTSLDFGSNSSLNTYVDEHTDKVTNRGAITVTVVQAYNLIAVDHDGFSDPYMKIKCSTPGISGNAIKFVTKTIQNDLNPVWDEVFTAPLPKHALTAEHVPIKCALYDSNRMLQDVLIGSFEFDLWDLIMDRINNEKYTLDPRSTGWIHLQLDAWFTLKMDDKALALSIKRQSTKVNFEVDPNAQKNDLPSRVRIQFTVLLPPHAMKGLNSRPQRPLPPGMKEFTKEADGDLDLWREEIVFPVSLALSPIASPETALYQPSHSGHFNESDSFAYSPRTRQPTAGSDQGSMASGKSIKARFTGLKKAFSRKEKDGTASHDVLESAGELYQTLSHSGSSPAE